MAQQQQQFFTFGKVSQMAYIPTRRSENAVAYHLRSAYNVLIEPNDRDTVTTDIWLSMPQGCVAVLTPCSDWTENTMLDIVCKVFDIPYVSNIGVIIKNHSSYRLEIPRGSRIGQLVFHNVPAALNCCC